MNNLRVMIADGSATYKKMFMQAVAELNKNAVVTCVSDKDEVLYEIRCRDYEFIIVDTELSDLSTLLKEIKLNIPKTFVLVTARPSVAGENLCAEALLNGASSCLIKPIHQSYRENYDTIKSKIAQILNELVAGQQKSPARAVKSEKAGACPTFEKNITDLSRLKPDLVLIASSTGGPQALDIVIPELKKEFPVPVLVVQHMLPKFTDTLAYNLDRRAMLKVKVAEHGETAVTGTVYIAPGGMHMRLIGEKTLRLDEAPPVNGVRPAADVLFASVANAYAGKEVLAVILTGMGHDGEKGILGLKEKCCCFCIAQSEATCVVYGMPRAVVESGLADTVIDLDSVAPTLNTLSDKG